MITIKSLKNLTFDTLFTSFSDAFADYAVHFQKEEVRRMLKRRGFNDSLSFGAFDDERLVSFTFNGIGHYLGKKTAYDTGTGTINEYRGQGLAGKIFEYSLPYLREAGVEQYLLEVLQENKPAVSVYKKQGFEITREFNCYTASVSDLKLEANNRYEIKPVDLLTVKQKNMCSFNPSWQNSYDSIQRSIEDFTILGAFDGSELVGYIISELASGDITQVEANTKYNNLFIYGSLLFNLLNNNKLNTLKVINVDTRTKTVNDYLKSIGFQLSSKQFEMIRDL